MRDFSLHLCPHCDRPVFTRRDLLYAALDGTAKCRKCGRAARPDLMGRWAISALIALVLPALLLYWGVFYSGHLFVVSMVIILGAWRVLSWLAFPILTLEAVPSNCSLDRKQSILMLAVLLVVAILFDGYMAARFEPDSAVDADPRPASARRL